MEELRIGTSGYDYLDWREAFYPSGLKRNEFLEYYSERFSTLELNFSYYRMPTREQLAGILERSSRKIDISIKAHQSLTHRIDPDTWTRAAGEFASSLAPLREAERLTAVLLQFPYSFHYTTENRRYLDRLIQALRGLPLVVEYRNSQWYIKKVFDALRERGVGFCSVDTPRLKGLPSPLDIVTSEIAYIRFHGRNDKTWWGSDAAARFDYSYSSEELKPWADRIIDMMRDARKLRIYFNNHRRGQAPADALKLKSLLAEQGIDAG